MEYRHFKKGDITRTWRVDNGIVLTTIEIGGLWVSNPTITQIEADGWVEYIVPVPEPVEPTREEKIHEEIRARYTDNDELMILRQYASNPSNPAYKTAFDEYNTFVEEVLAKYPEPNE